jgi:glycosyltransferase involved in cell wall biosynthesis
MVTACTTVDAGRVEEARRLAASLAEHDPRATLAVLVLDREERAVDPRREPFLVVTPSDLHLEDVDVLAAAYDADELARALAPAMLRMLLAQNDHVVILDRATRLTGSLQDVAAAIGPAGGVLVDADGRPVGLGRGAAAEALLDSWEQVVRSRAGVAPPAAGDAAVLDGLLPWKRAGDDAAGEATGWETTWNGFRMDAAMRHAFREGWRSGRLRRGPYDPFGEEAFFDDLAAPGRRGAWAGVTRYMEAVHATDPAVRARTGDDLDGDGATALVAWLRGEGAAALDPPPHALTGRPETAAPNAAAAVLDPPPFGVNLVGYLRAELGVAEVARQLIGALDTQGVPLLPIGIEADTSRQGHDFAQVEQFANPFAVNLLCVNADQTPRIAEEAGRAFFAGRYTIGLWWWEVSDFPEYFRSAFAAVDEVWAGSAFVADTLRAVSPRPVVQIPMPVTLPPGVAPDRARFGFGDDVTFLYVFDYNSIVERKNPLGLVEAYLRAFPAEVGGTVPSGTRLVLKCINNARHPEAHARVLEAAAGREDIQVIDAYLSAGEKDALLASCDCYVSLHRSEGFGLTCAEAMLLGKPVIATGYSGAADFMDPGHSLPVGWTLMPIGPGNEPYPADGEWADPDLDEAAAHMRAVAQDPALRRELGERARAFIEREHSPQAAGAAIRARLEVVAAMAPAAGRQVPVPSTSPALDRARDVVNGGPPPGSGPRWHPRRLARAVALRATAPRARHQHAVDRQIVDATEWAVAEAARTTAAAAHRAETEAWRSAAQSLREQRRMAARMRAVELEVARSAAALRALGERVERS